MGIARQIQLLYLLAQKPLQSARELSSHLEVSTRTIYRDIEALSIAGFPVFSMPGRSGGIGLAQGYVIDKMVFSTPEKQELLYALQSYEQATQGKSELLEKLTGFFQQPASDWIEIDFSGWDPKQKERFGRLKESILERKVISFDYYGANKLPSYRSVYPCKMLFRNTKWYLSGYDCKAEEMRIFKISRIHNLFFTDQNIPSQFVPPIQSMPEHLPGLETQIILLLDSSVHYRIYDEFTTSQVEVQEDGNFLVTCHFIVDNWVMGWLLSFGNGLLGIRPEWLQIRFQETLQKMWQQDYTMT